jgi:hypothetical protein
MANEWAWSPLAVGDTSCNLGVEEAEALTTLHQIMGMGFERSLRFSLRYK